MTDIVSAVGHVHLNVADVHWSLGTQVVQHMSCINQVSMLLLAEQFLLGNVEALAYC